MHLSFQPGFCRFVRISWAPPVLVLVLREYRIRKDFQPPHAQPPTWSEQQASKASPRSLLSVAHYIAL
ncbi:hypothetical protein TWF788_011160 [Orbilia oligospora]|uniref:Uncharacterized protein n=1 Tax=Orbilia oligospora TaxID=2813651 RepID=A0A7C8Q1Q4_ORBOL|nr:hypothetical protein TWF788_011160 [Orbilia oligospora]